MAEDNNNVRSCNECGATQVALFKILLPPQIPAPGIELCRGCLSQIMDNTIHKNKSKKDGRQ